VCHHLSTLGRSRLFPLPLLPSVVAYLAAQEETAASLAAIIAQLGISLAGASTAPTVEQICGLATTALPRLIAKLPPPCSGHVRAYAGISWQEGLRRLLPPSTSGRAQAVLPCSGNCCTTAPKALPDGSSTQPYGAAGNARVWPMPVRHESESMIIAITVAIAGEDAVAARLDGHVAQNVEAAHLPFSMPGLHGRGGTRPIMELANISARRCCA